MNNLKGSCDLYGRSSDSECCRQKDKLPCELSYAMAYVPFQQWCSSIYTAEKALCQGTLFPALDLPFTQAGRCR